MLEHEQSAETAYSAMYDAQPWDEKDLKDEALVYLMRAIEVAEALGLNGDVRRLKARVDKIMGVYKSAPAQPMTSSAGRSSSPAACATPWSASTKQFPRMGE